MKKSWEVLAREPIIDHPFLKVEMEKVVLPNGRVISDWPMVHTRDYVNVLAFNEHGETLILEGYKHGPGRSGWQVVGGYLEADEDPFQAVQRELLEETGYYSDEWRYLSSYVMDANRHVGTGHFFLALNARQISQPDNDDLEDYKLRWVPISELKLALLDGRIMVVSYAINICLGLMAIEKLVKEQTLSRYFARANV
jgi:ADP-ribose pyrophosphatase